MWHMTLWVGVKVIIVAIRVLPMQMNGQLSLRYKYISSEVSE